MAVRTVNKTAIDKLPGKPAIIRTAVTREIIFRIIALRLSVKNGIFPASAAVTGCRITEVIAPRPVTSPTVKLL